MAVSSTDSKVIYTGSGTTGPFDFDFKVFTSSELVVTRYAISDGSTTTFAETTNYTVSIDADGTGSVTLVAALTSSYKLIISRVLPLTQEIAYVEGDKFPSASHERGLDRATMRDQQLQEQIDRAVLQNPLATTTVTLPIPVTGNALVWNASGQLENSDEALVGPTGATGPAGPAGSGSGDVLGPATNTDLKVPQWDGANTKTLKDGLTVGTSANNLIQLNGSAQIPAVDGSLLTGVSTKIYIGTINKNTADATTSTAYTGIGFLPKVIFIWSAAIDASTYNCMGYCKTGLTQNYIQNVAGVYTAVNSAIVKLHAATTNYQTGVVSALGADGFTIDWTKSGSPTGTANIYYIALG